MTLTSAPTKITEAMNRLLECTSVQSLLSGLSSPDQQARFWYPEADPINADLPFVVLSRLSEDYETVSSGGSMGRGEIEAVFFIDNASAIGTVESLVSVAQEIVCLRTDGIFVVRARATRASDVTSEMEAGEDSTADVGRQFRTITVTLDWEG